MKKIGIYVHIPFCKQKCKYCDFVSFQGMEHRVEEYFEGLSKEILEKVNELKDLEGVEQCLEVDTLYIGGGTPSIVPAQYIEKIVSLIFNNFRVSKDAEVTIEINPGTVDEIKLRKYLEIGINRVSIGLQSTNDELLKMLGRIHNYEEFETVYESARNVRF